MTTKGMSIEVPVPTYDAAWNMVDGILAGLNMDQENRFKVLGAMAKLQDAVRIAKSKEQTQREPGTKEGHD